MSTPEPSREGRSGAGTFATAWPKTHADHLANLAIVYVRQSSPQQVQENRASTARQYA
jgi:hypothetical protein